MAIADSNAMPPPRSRQAGPDRAATLVCPVIAPPRRQPMFPGCPLSAPSIGRRERICFTPVRVVKHVVACVFRCFLALRCTRLRQCEARLRRAGASFGSRGDVIPNAGPVGPCNALHWARLALGHEATMKALTAAATII